MQTRVQISEQQSPEQLHKCSSEATKINWGKYIRKQSDKA
jgi:hypothetical protein